MFRILNLKFIILLSIVGLSCAVIRNILHLSDIHADIHYHAGAPQACIIGTRLGTGCCRALDVPMPGSHKCSPWGAPDTDVPLKLVNATLQWIATRVDPWAIFQTGDDCSHHDVTQSPEENIKTIDTIQRMIEYAFPNVPIFNALGNHDTYPIDQTPPLLYRAMLRRISNVWFHDNQAEHGFYAEPLHHGVTVVVINPIYYDSNNFFRVRNDLQERMTTGQQFVWLEQQFNRARSDDKKIILLNHIPINGSESTPYFNRKLTSVLQRHADVLLLHLNGHEHSDHMYLYQNTFSTIPNSIVPSGNFPGFRVYQYDDDSRTFMDYRQYGCNLTKIIETNRFSCEELYNFKNLYDTTDLTFASVSAAVRRLGTNVTLANKYLWYRNFGASVPDRCTNLACANRVMQSIVVGN